MKNISKICGCLFVSVCIPALLCACNPGPKSAVGFRLPTGSPELGQQAFIDLKCVSCHSVDGVKFGTNDVIGHFNVVLGGETLQVRTYGQLVTSIINPSHIVSAKYREQLKMEGNLSPMPEFNKVMTVEQMVNLVAFLQPHYHLPAVDVIVAN